MSGHDHLDPYESTALARAGLSLKLLVHAHPPVEYLCGSVEFADRRFAVTPATLIPRVESEQLLALAQSTVASHWSKRQILRVLDLGCGSGVLGLSLGLAAPRRPKLQITLADVSPAALRVAKYNYRLLWPSRSPHQVRFVRSWLWQKLAFGAPYQLVLANLPYIPHPRLASLDASVTQHEPQKALDGGEDGLQLIRAMLASAHRYTTQDAQLLLEVDDSHKLSVLEPLASPIWRVQTLKDFQGKNRFAIFSRDPLGATS